MKAEHTYLTVPVQIDALLVEGVSMAAVRRSPDYSRLPYYDASIEADVNADLAYVAESILPQPFANANLLLEPGLHLHWAMPDALAHGELDSDSGEIVFPALPTRWLITRTQRIEDAEDTEFRTHRWIVESDYVTPVGVTRSASAISIPLVAQDQEGLTQPYRYLGRTMPLLAWPADPTDSEDRYLTSPEFNEPLTVFGFGDPTFAAYYPSCHGVFGFHDPTPPDDLSTVRYEVLGWYADRFGEPTTDPLQKCIDTAGTDNAEQALKDCLDEFDWDVKLGKGPLPSRVLCVASMTFEPDPDKVDRADEAPIVTVANSPSEAIAAHVARVVTEERGPGGNGAASQATRARLQAQIEQALEIVQIQGMLDETTLDLSTVLRAMKHETRFSAAQGGTSWRVRTDANDDAPTLTDPGKIAEQSNRTPLDYPVCKALRRVNDLQKTYDQGRADIDGLQLRLFADWYKYMLTLYPPDVTRARFFDPDHIRLFIERVDLPPLEELRLATGDLVFENDLATAHVVGGGEHSAARRLLDALNELAIEVGRFHTSLPTEERNAINLFIESVPDNRFWEPNEPVVLIAGDMAKETDRYDNDAAIACTVFRLNTTAADLDTDAPRAAMAQAAAAAASDQLHSNEKLKAAQRGQTVWHGQPWNPVVLEWQVALFRLADISGDVPGSDTYSADFICDNYEAPILSPELELRRSESAGGIRTTPNIYSGSTILTTHASTLLAGEITNRLVTKSKAVDAFFKDPAQFDQRVLSEQKRRSKLADPDVLDRLLGWFKPKTKQALDDPTIALVAGLREVLTTPMLSQELAGFNDALLTRKDSTEFSIDDPVNFESYRAFSRDAVQASMQGAAPVAPRPQNGFNPIRAGSLKVLGLKVVDTFGQSRVVEPQQVQAPLGMSDGQSTTLIQLPPRIAQPTRLDFRWLDSTRENDEATTDMATTPICGWVMPNMLDRSLWFYDADGKPLGLFKTGVWRETPDTDTSVKIKDIVNPHLRRVVQFVEQAIASGIDNFDDTMLAVIDDALENIVTPNYRPPESAASLVGRPVAIVRAQMDLETYGPPAVSNTWPAFDKDLRSTTRSTAAFTKVQFPVRLGEFGQLGDGLIGYWLEERSGAGDDEGELRLSRARGTGGDDGDLPAVFYSPQSDYIDNAALETRMNAVSDGAINFHQTIDDPPQSITMLIEPHGSVHLTTGILPQQELRIPPEMFADVLDKIEVGFLHAPMLTPAGRKELPLRSSLDYDWSWVEEQHGQWVEFHPNKRVTRSATIDAWETWRMQLPPLDPDGRLYGDGNAVWQALTDAGWLEAVGSAPDMIDARDNPDGQHPAEFEIVEASQRTEDALQGFAGHEAMIDQMLNAIGIGVDHVVTQATFGRTNEIREGWMKLRRAEKPLEMGTQT